MAILTARHAKFAADLTDIRILALVLKALF